MFSGPWKCFWVDYYNLWSMLMFFGAWRCFWVDYYNLWSMLMFPEDFIKVHNDMHIIAVLSGPGLSVACSIVMCGPGGVPGPGGSG